MSVVFYVSICELVQKMPRDLVSLDVSFSCPLRAFYIAIIATGFPIGDTYIYGQMKNNRNSRSLLTLLCDSVHC